MKTTLHAPLTAAMPARYLSTDPSPERAGRSARGANDPDGVFRRIHGFVVIAFIAASRRLRGANGAPLRSLDIAVGE